MPYKRITSFNGYFYKEDFLDCLLDLEDLFDFESIYYERKINLPCINIVGMPYLGRNEYSLIELDKVKIKFVSWPKMKKMLSINFLSFGL